MTTMQDYNRLLVDWRSDVDAFAEAVRAYAAADGAWKAHEARNLITEKHRDPKIAVDLAKAFALNTEDGEQLYTAREVAEAHVEALKRKLQWDAAMADNLRTNVVQAREEHKFSSTAGAGPGVTVEPPTQPSGPPPRTPPQYERQADAARRDPDVWVTPDAEEDAWHPSDEDDYDGTQRTREDFERTRAQARRGPVRDRSLPQPPTIPDGEPGGAERRTGRIY